MSRTYCRMCLIPAVIAICSATAGAADVAALMRALKDGDDAARMEAAFALGAAPGEAAAAVGPLVEALKDKQFYVRGNAAWALGQMGPAAAAAAAPLAYLAAGTDDYGVRIQAIKALAQIGAIKSLETLLRAPDEKNAVLAVWALGHAGPGGAGALGAAMGDPREAVAAAAAPCLARQGAAAMEPLRAHLKGQPTQRLNALESLMRIGPAAAAAVDDIAALTNDSDERVAQRAAAALRAVGARDAGEKAAQKYLAVMAVDEAVRGRQAQKCLVALGEYAAGPLGKALASGGDDGRGALLEVAQAMGPAARPLVGQLLELFQKDYAANPKAYQPSGDDFRRRPVLGEQILAVLMAIGTPEASAAPALAKAVKDLPPARAYALEALASLGAGGAAGAANIVWASEEQDAQTRLRALAALACIGPAAGSSVGAVVRRLGDDEFKVRLLALYALGRLGQATPEVIEALEKAVAGKNVGEAMVAAESLGRLGPAAKRTVPQIKKRIITIGIPAVQALRAMGVSQEEISAAIIDEGSQRHGRVIREAGLSRDAMVLLAETDLASYAAVSGLLGANEQEEERTYYGVRSLIGPAAVPALIKCLSPTKPKLCRAAAKTLECLGPQGQGAADEALLKIVLYKNTPETGIENYFCVEMSRDCAQALASSGPKGLAMILKQCSSPDEDVRRYAVAALAAAPKTPEVLKTLQEALKDKNVRYPAMRVLAEFGPGGAPAAQTVLQVIEEDGTSAEAVNALVSMKVATEEVLSLVNSKLAYGSSPSCRQAFRELCKTALLTRKIGCKPEPPLIPAGIAQLRDKMKELNRESFAAARELADNAATRKEGVDYLIAASKNQDERMAAESLQYLAAVWPPDDSIIDALAAAAEYRTPDDKKVGSLLLSSILPTSVKMAARINALAKKERLSRVDSLRLRPEIVTTEYLPVIIEMLAGGYYPSDDLYSVLDVHDTQKVMEHIGKLLSGDDAEAAFLATCYCEHSGSRAAAVQKQLVAVVARLLKKDNHQVDNSIPVAARALAQMGPAAAPSMPALLDIAQKSNGAPEVIAALNAIGPGRREDLPALVAMLKNPGAPGTTAAVVMRTWKSVRQAAPHVPAAVVASLAGKAVVSLPAEERLAAIEALLACGRAAQTPARALIERYQQTTLEIALDREDDRFRRQRYADYPLPPSAKDLLPQAIRLLSEKFTSPGDDEPSISRLRHFIEERHRDMRSFDD
ncbi:MAG: HEAT repeat domain-containing protein [Planctomycetaceae bacterium]|nr:HEAT repeat domain-containing protein [Planctomycetaceae bacterium]